MTGTTNQNINIPLCVDCDGTLIRTDILFESILKYLALNPFRIFTLLFWLLHGKAVLKNNLASKIRIAAAGLPYNHTVLEYIKLQKDAGRSIILVTASHQENAAEIESFLHLFDEVYGTSGGLNLKGSNKARFLTDKYGENGFDYVGDSVADLAVWKKARTALIIGNNSNLYTKLITFHNNVIPLEGTPAKGIKKYIKLIRVHQWAKNFIIFIPLLTSHSLVNFSEGILAFLSFSLIASTTYIINDLLDLDNDRSHHSKKNRPVASGAISIQFAIILAIVLLLAGTGLLFIINNISFALLALCYFGLTLLYSFRLKKILLVDTIVLSVLYCIRLLGGHLAMNVPLSFWLLSFSIFFFFSLALAKRFMEIKYSSNLGSNGKINGRGYEENDMLPVGILGVSSGMLSIAIFSIYLQSERVLSLYRSPILLIFLVPIFLYWVSRVWILAYRGILNEDPVVFALKDRISYLLFAIILLVILAASAFTL